MTFQSINITQEDPVHFRVQGLGPIPVPELSPMLDITLMIEIVDKPATRHYGIPMAWLAPHREAVQNAISSQDVYWVDLDYSKTRDFPPLGVEDGVVFRILKAIENRQIVSGADSA